MPSLVLERRRNTLAFWCGCLLVVAGVLLHLPMFVMARGAHYRLAGMPMDRSMAAGMGAIVTGVLLACYGLLPRLPARRSPDALRQVITHIENAPLTAAHWRVAALLALALVIDVMKPASLGFVTPGMRSEYGIDARTVAWLPFAALAGTVAGSFLWGTLADLYGRRASIVLSSVMFVGTSICGAMPGFWWNVLMCFMMGAAAGGMLPVAYALLAEIMPRRHRGWSLVLVGGVGAVGGFFAASALSAVLQPLFGWRIMWFLNLPTGLILVLLSPLLPESARFLALVGRMDVAQATLARFGVVLTQAAPATAPKLTPQLRTRGSLVGITAALTLSGLVWGLVNFGVLLWLPATLVAEGRSVSVASGLIARSTLIALPTVVLCTWMFSAWSSKRSLVAMTAVMVAGLAGLASQQGAGGLPHPVIPLALIVIGSCGVISMLLPYAAENFPLWIRGRATGWVAACSKLGGLIAQTLSVLGAVPSLRVSILTIAVPALASGLMIGWFGHETRGRDLEDNRA
ncbi:MAG: MFS transporter [Proteobacteria bacterium]|nr:MFS transporter [Pseudomonadota bacterium]